MDIFNELEKECTYKTSRSGGAGGQHVNKVETKVQILWSISESKLFSLDQKKVLRSKLKSYLNDDDIIFLYVQRTRSQVKNKQIAQEKLVNLIKNAFIKVKRRKKTFLPKSVKEKRLRVKRMQSENKQNRKKVKW